MDATDPMFHLNSFFYGPMLKGRDGLGATPCAGTGVIFKRDVLVSIGGQSYGSITEDFNTAMHLLMSGFGTMYLDDHLTYGMAPDDVPSTFTQRLRWAMGAVQIYIRNNPLVIPGLTHAQAMLFYDSCASHFLAIGMVFVSLIPIVYMFSGAQASDTPCDACDWAGTMHTVKTGGQHTSSNFFDTQHPKYRRFTHCNHGGSGLGVCGRISCVLPVQSCDPALGISRLAHRHACPLAHLPTSGEHGG